MLLTPSDSFPSKAICNDSANPVDCAKDRAVPASIALMLNDRLALRLGALRLGAIRPYKPYYLKDLPCVLLKYSSRLLLKYIATACSTTNELVIFLVE